MTGMHCFVNEEFCGEDSIQAFSTPMVAACRCSLPFRDCVMVLKPRCLRSLGPLIFRLQRTVYVATQQKSMAKKTAETPTKIAFLLITLFYTSIERPSYMSMTDRNGLYHRNPIYSECFANRHENLKGL